MKHVLRVLLLLSTYNLNSQNLEVLGKVKISDMDTLNTVDSVVVKAPDGTLSLQSNKLRVSLFGDTLFIGPKWVIIPGISNINANLSGDIYDADGNFYSSIIIGTQEWLTENLKTTKFNNSLPISEVTDNSMWSDLTTWGYCWYNNDSATYADTYGALYNFHVVSAFNSFNICPVGWKVPSFNDFKTLENFLDPDNLNIAGGKLKEQGTVHWWTPNVGATNSSGFTALPGGYRTQNGDFTSVKSNGVWWSSTEASQYEARTLFLNSSTAGSSVGGISLREHGFSVRCVKD